MSRIMGEYWIDDTGQVHFADGNIGDADHESIAQQAMASEFSDSIIDYANDLNIDTSHISENNSDFHLLSKLIMHIYTNLYNKGNSSREIQTQIMSETGLDEEGFKAMFHDTGAADYMRLSRNWIAIRGHNIDLHGYNERKRQSLARGLPEILEQEGIDDGIPPEEIEFGLYDSKTLRITSVTLADIENPQAIARPIVPATLSGDRRFIKPTPLETGAWAVNRTIQPPKIGNKEMGREIWRGTSESISFKSWLVLNG